MKMKMTRTMKQMMLTAGLVLSLAACKKGNTPEPPAPPVEVKTMTITELKALSTTAEVKVPDAKKLSGVVISDLKGKNIDGKTVVIQEGDNMPGIIINFETAQTFATGDKLEVNISGQKLLQQNGEIILSQVPGTNVKKIGTGTITPKMTTASEAIKNAALWNGTLISLADGVLIGGGGKYTGILGFEDKSSAALKSSVMAGATFEHTAYPASVGIIKGILRIRGTDVFLDIRTSEDITTGLISRLLVDDMVLTTPFGSIPDNDPYFFGFSAPFKTKISDYYALSPMGYYPGDKYDGTILSKERSYIYMLGSAASLGSNYVKADASVNLKDLKEITITFAGSKMAGNAIISSYFSVLPFDPEKDVFKLGLDILNTSLVSAEFKETGKFYTVKFKIPSRDELIKNNTAGSVDQWLAAPDFNLKNLSTRVAGTDFDNKTAPIIIKEIVFGF